MQRWSSQAAHRVFVPQEIFLCCVAHRWWRIQPVLLPGYAAVDRPLQNRGHSPRSFSAQL